MYLITVLTKVFAIVLVIGKFIIILYLYLNIMQCIWTKVWDLLILNSRDILDTAVGEAAGKAEALGKEQHKLFVDERFIKCEKLITDAVSKNKPSSKQKCKLQH